MCGLILQIKAKPYHILTEEEERERYKMGEEDTNEEGERESERESGGRVIVFYVNIAMNH